MAVSIADLAIRVDASQLRIAALETQRLTDAGRRAETTANQMSSSWGRFGGVLASIGLGLGVRQLIDYMDTWANIEGRLKLVTRSTQELIDIQAKLFNTANATRSSLEGTVDLYTKLARAQTELGMTSDQLIKITETIGKSMIISGAGAAQASAAILQLGQAFASGILAGDEYRSVAENSPRLIRAIAEGWENANGTIGVSIGKLRQLSRDQQLDIERVTKAIARSTANIDSEFAKMPVTIGQAFTVANNELLKFIGAGGQTSGVASALADAVLVLARNIDTITGTLLVGAGAWATYKMAVMGLSFAGFISGVGAAIGVTVAHTEALAMNSAVNAQSAVATATAYAETISASLARAESELALAESNAAIVYSDYEVVQSALAANQATLNLTRSELLSAEAHLTAAQAAGANSFAIYNIGLATERLSVANAQLIAAEQTHSASLTELTALGQMNLSTQAALATAQARATALAVEQTAAESSLMIATAGATAAQNALTVSTSLTGRAFAFLGGILPAIKQELAAIGIIAMANPYALLATAIVAAGTALYLFRDAAIGTTENAAVKEYNDNIAHANGLYKAGLITEKELNAEIQNQKEFIKDSTEATIELGDYFVGFWDIVKNGAGAAGDYLKNQFGDAFKWIEEHTPNWSKMFDFKLPAWLTNAAGDVARARKVIEDAQAAEDNKVRGTVEITDQGLKFNKNQEEYYVKLAEQVNKLTVSEHDRAIKAIIDMNLEGKELQAMLDMQFKIDDAKEKGLKNGEVEKSQIKEIQDLAKSSIDAQIADINRLTDAKLQSYGLENDILKNQYDDNLITAQQFHDARIALINKERDATVLALAQTQTKYTELSIDMMDMSAAYQAILKIESNGNKAQVNPTSHALGQMQVLPSTLSEPGYGITPFQPAIDQNISRLTDYNTLLKFVQQNEEGLKKFGESYFKGLVEHYGSVTKAVQAYGEHTDAYMTKFKSNYADITGQTKESIELSTKLKDTQASQATTAINATKETIAVNRELKKAVEDYGNAVESSKIKYLEMTGQTAQAAIEADNLAKSVDNVRKQAVLLGDKDALKFIDALRTVNADLAPLQAKIKYFGLLEQEVSRATAAEYEEAAALNKDPSQIAFLKAKAQGFRDVADAQEQLAGKQYAKTITAEMDNGLTDYINKMYELKLAQEAGLDPAIVERYNQKLIEEFNLSSPAGQQAHEFFDVLKETSSQGFEAMLENGASASEAMESMFTNMTDNIAASFMKLGQNSLFDWIETGTMKDGGWMNVAVAGLSMGAKLLANVLGADQPTQTKSTAQSYRSNELGASQMAMIDSLSRDTGFNFATKAAAIFNNNLQTFSNSVQNHATQIFDGISSIGEKIAQTQAFQTVSNWMGTLGDGISKVTSLFSEGWGIVNKFYTSATNSIASFLGFTEKAGEVAAQGGLSGAGQAMSKVVGQALAVVGAIYSIYTFATGIGDLIDNGTVGQIVGSVMQLSASLYAAALVLVGSSNPIGYIAAAVVAVVGFLVSFFDEARKPLLMITSVGSALNKFDGIKEVQFPSGRGAIKTDSAFGTIELRSQYQGGLNAEQLNNAAGGLLTLMSATDDAMAAAFDKIDQQKQTSNYIRANLNQYIEQNLESADVSKMIEKRYEAIIDLAGQSGTYAGIAFNKIFDILMSKFKAFDQNTLAAMGMASSIAGNLQAFIDTVPLSFWDLVNNRIEGVGSNKTAEQFTADLNKGIMGFVALKTVLNSIGTISDDAVVAIMDSKGAIDTIAINMAQFVISLKTLNSSIGIDQVIAEINHIKSVISEYSDTQATAFFNAFGSFSRLALESYAPVGALEWFSKVMVGVAGETTRAANAAINYAIAENHLAGVSRESAIQTLLRTKAIDEATIAEADLSLAVQQATKTQLDAMGFISTFVIAAGASFAELNVQAAAWFIAGRNVVTIFGDMKAAADFYTKMTSAFLSDDEQKKAANAIAKNNVKNLLSAANDANLGATLGIGTLNTSNTTKWITDLLKAGVGIDGMISAFSDVGQGTLFKSLFEAMAELKTTTDSLAGATQKLTEASKAQLAITLDEWLQKNKLSGLSNLSDFDKNREFMQQINSTYSSALRGNEKAGNSLTGLIDEYLSFAQKYNPADFEEVSVWARSLVSNLMESIKPDGSHYSGLNSVPYDGYIAELHKDERVLTASESLSYDKLMIGLSNQSSKQTIEVKINQDKNDNTEQIAILIKSMQVMQEGHKQTIAELKKTNAELAELKASARRREVKA